MQGKLWKWNADGVLRDFQILKKRSEQDVFDLKVADLGVVRTSLRLVFSCLKRILACQLLPCPAMPLPTPEQLALFNATLDWDFLALYGIEGRDAGGLFEEELPIHWTVVFHPQMASLLPRPPLARLPFLLRVVQAADMEKLSTLPAAPFPSRIRRI
jgi:hypothetical protein